MDSLGIEKVERIGVVFRYLAWIQATSSGLSYEWVENTLQDIRVYEAGLGHTMQQLGWS